MNPEKESARRQVSGLAWQYEAKLLASIWQATRLHRLQTRWAVPEAQSTAGFKGISSKFSKSSKGLDSILIRQSLNLYL